ncbi:MAG: hypothetical protein ABIL70_09090 [candidate division WOR-3 bacterium]
MQSAKPNTIMHVIGIAVMITALNTANAQKPKKLEPIDVSYTVPEILPVDSAQQMQERSGIKISITPVAFSAERKIKATYEQKPTLLVINDQYNFDKREIPYYDVSPETLIFKLKLYNNLGHVFRPAGTVVSFLVDGKMVALDKAGYENFLSAIILPRQEQEYEIIGPPIATLPDSCTIAFLLFDMITQTDAAGNPTEKTNFEWYYTYRAKKVTVADTVKVFGIKMTPDQARSVGAWKE